MPRLIIIFFLLTGISVSISAQNFFVTNLPVEGKDNSLYLKFESTSFFKNNEYKSSLADGYTLTGTWLRPKLVYLPSDKVQLELGWHYLRFNGSEDAKYSLPWFSAKINFLKNWQLIFGNLNNSNNHRLISPIWDPEHFLIDKPEGGFQILHNSEKLYLDTWLNWEQFIWYGDPFQEFLTAGVSADYKLVHSGLMTLTTPVQVLIHHRGGEIDASNSRVQTFANYSVGLNSEWELNGFFQSVGFSGNFVAFSDQKGNGSFPFEYGTGWFFEGNICSRFGKVGLNYWSAEKFYAIKGMELFKMVPGFQIRNSNLDYKKTIFSLFYDYHKEISQGIIFGARIEGWFETKPDYSSNTAAIYLIVNQDFLLKQF